ncbi:MAG TPA: PaaI family thioesterase [Ktedonobacteraceae bacterium]|nr:PaaI family thioesterase [Ktedonobacteraceae bacterium]
MGEEQQTRSRTFTWEDPVAAARAGKALSGMEHLQAIQRGELPGPPIAHLMGMDVHEVSEGRIIFTLRPEEYHYNPIGMVHGGVAATLLDSSMGCVVQSMLPKGHAYTTLEIKINYLRAITVNTGLLYSEAHIIHLGGRIAMAEGQITDEDGKVYAHGTSTCLLMRS